MNEQPTARRTAPTAPKPPKPKPPKPTPAPLRAGRNGGTLRSGGREASGNVSDSVRVSAPPAAMKAFRERLDRVLPKGTPARTQTIFELLNSALTGLEQMSRRAGGTPTPPASAGLAHAFATRVLSGEDKVERINSMTVGETTVVTMIIRTAPPETVVS